METPQDVLISGERHLIIMGQLGNIGVKLARLNRACIDANNTVLVGMCDEMAEELGYLRSVYPKLDGSFEVVAVQPSTLEDSTNIRHVEYIKDGTKIRNALRDVKSLVEAAYLSYIKVGLIDCHLKTMFDNAWKQAADEAGIDNIDDIPF